MSIFPSIAERNLFLQGTGVSFLTFTSPESVPDGDYSMGTGQKCVILDAAPGSSIALTTEASCAQHKAVCKAKMSKDGYLRQGYPYSNISLNIVELAY